MNNNFWQANFWGILGSFSGISSIIISWLAFKNTTPDIVIDNLVLIKPEVSEMEDFRGSDIKYEIDILIRNRKGGTGSIDKPTLLIHLPNGKILSIIQLYETIPIPPKTEEVRIREVNSIVSEHTTIRQGYTFNIKGGESIDDRLEYKVKDIYDIIKISKNYDKLSYSISYRFNSGEPRVDRIKRVYSRSELR